MNDAITAIATALAVIALCASLAWCNVEQGKTELARHQFDVAHGCKPSWSSSCG